MDEDDADNAPAERASDPAARAIEKSNEIRIHAELAAVFEGPRKFDAAVRPGLDAGLARDVQRTMARLDKARADNSPIVPDPPAPDGAALLDFYASHDLTTGDYHVHRRPGETMVVRWLAGEEVDTFYARLQAHFDAALEGCREEQREQAWKQDADTDAYLAALEALDVKMADRYLRDLIPVHKFVVLSTQTADEMNIAYLCDVLMGLPAAEVVGARSAPSESPSESELAWFFKLFLLRGVVGGEARMCFFTYLQKTDDSFDDEAV